MVLSTQLPDEPDMILSPLVSTHTPKPLPPLSLRRTNGVGNHHPNAILATQSLDTISEGPFAHYRISGNESTKTTTEPYHPPAQGPEPASYIYKTRHGYWNRRGDHLTPTGYLVYAPPHLAYPDDLRMYPPESEGYMDHNGLYTPWCQRPELPASLPRMGNEPELPYEKVILFYSLFRHD
jgi:hypothetical protein